MRIQPKEMSFDVDCTDREDPSMGQANIRVLRTRMMSVYILGVADPWKQRISRGKINQDRHAYATFRWTPRKNGLFSTRSKSRRFVPLVRLNAPEKARSYVNNARSM